MTTYRIPILAGVIVISILIIGFVALRPKPESGTVSGEVQHMTPGAKGSKKQ
ncbi:hypothetical protein BH11ARM1_BH11ARM1_11560 [soil metagenome]